MTRSFRYVGEKTTFDVFPYNFDVFISIGTRLLVPESENVNQLVLNDSSLHAVRRQAHVTIPLVMRSTDRTFAAFTRVKPNVLLSWKRLIERLSNNNAMRECENVLPIRRSFYYPRTIVLLRIERSVRDAFSAVTAFVNQLRQVVHSVEDGMPLFRCVICRECVS